MNMLWKAKNLPLSTETCAELTATTKRRKITECDHSIRTRLAKAKEQSKQPAVAEGKKYRTHSKGNLSRIYLKYVGACGRIATLNNSTN